MIHFYINLDYTADPEGLMYDNSTEVSSATKFISFCMHATGVYRLFEKDTVEEFLYRLAIVLKKYAIIDNFFTNDMLVAFNNKKHHFEFHLKDVVAHLGIEIADSIDDMVEREQWQAKIAQYWRNACIVAVFTDSPIIDRKKTGKNKYQLAGNKPEIVEDDYTNTALLLSKEAAKTIGERQFAELTERVAERKEYLSMQRSKILKVPAIVFDYKNIPIGIKKRFFESAYRPVGKLKEMFDEFKSDENSDLAAIMFLAYLWINGHVTVFKATQGPFWVFAAEVNPCIDFDYARYDGLHSQEFGGISLWDTYHDFKLYKTARLLKEKGRQNGR